MVVANFTTYGLNVSNYLYQWDSNQTLTINGLNLVTAPEIHFYNRIMDRAIVRRATLENGVITVTVPNTLMQQPYRITAAIVTTASDGTQKTVERAEIDVVERQKPSDYTFIDQDNEVYSYNELRKMCENTVKFEDLEACYKQCLEVSEGAKSTMEQQYTDFTQHVYTKNKHIVDIFNKVVCIMEDDSVVFYDFIPTKQGSVDPFLKKITFNGNGWSIDKVFQIPSDVDISNCKAIPIVRPIDNNMLIGGVYTDQGIVDNKLQLELQCTTFDASTNAFAGFLVTVFFYDEQ